METIIIEHADRRTSQIFKQMAKALGLSVKIKAELEPQTKESIITNPEIIRRIEKYETKKNTPTTSFTLDELKKEMQNFTTHA